MQSPLVSSLLRGSIGEVIHCSFSSVPRQHPSPFLWLKRFGQLGKRGPVRACICLLASLVHAHTHVRAHTHYRHAHVSSHTRSCRTPPPHQPGASTLDGACLWGPGLPGEGTHSQPVWGQLLGLLCLPDAPAPCGPSGVLCATGEQGAPTPFARCSTPARPSPPPRAARPGPRIRERRGPRGAGVEPRRWRL